MEQIEMYTVEDLNKILNSVDEMILIPIHNVHGLNLTELKKIREQVLTELNKR